MKEFSKVTGDLWPELPALVPPTSLPQPLPAGASQTHPPSPPDPRHLVLSQLLLLSHQGSDALPGGGHLGGLQDVWLVITCVRVLLTVVLGVGLLALLLPPLECPARLLMLPAAAAPPPRETRDSGHGGRHSMHLQLPAPVPGGGGCLPCNGEQVAGGVDLHLHGVVLQLQQVSPHVHLLLEGEIGRASCRERVSSPV